MKIIVDEKNSNLRLDLYLLEELNLLSRNKVQTLIKNGDVLVNGLKVKTGYLLKTNDLLSINLEVEEKASNIVSPTNLNLEVIYEDDDLAIINKPKGLVVHPASSYEGVTLVDGLLYQIKPLSNVNGSDRPGIIHRLDKDTGGLIIVAKSDLAHQRLVRSIAGRKIEKKYYAICYGTFNESHGTINMPIARDPKNRLKMAVMPKGRDAVTHFKVLKQFKNHSLLELDLITGRTHQIRVHLKAIGHPILGDPIYGPKNSYGSKGQYLFAYYLKFKHPITKKELQIELELPSDFNLAIQDLT